MTLIKLAWRNSWRNKRRSLNTTASIVLALFFVILVESLNEGLSEYLINNEIKMYTAHLEINNKGYLQNRTVGHAMTNLDDLEESLLTLPEVSSVARRIEMLVIAFASDKSKPGFLWGIDMDKEFQFSYLFGNDVDLRHSVAIGTDMLNFLELSVHDSILLVGQSYYGRISAAQFPIDHIFQIPIRDISERVIIANIDLVKAFSDLPNGATSLHINLHDRDKAELVKEKILLAFNANDYDIRTWQETLSGRIATFKLRTIVSNVLKIILILILGFAILSTILITNNERKREYVILLAMGMKRLRLMRLILIEMFFVAVFGILIGLVLVVPVVTVFHYNPITLWGELAMMMVQFNVEPLLIMSASPAIFLRNAAIVLILTMALTASSLIMVWHMKAVQPMNQ